MALFDHELGPEDFPVSMVSLVGKTLEVFMVGGERRAPTSQELREAGLGRISRIEMRQALGAATMGDHRDVLSAGDQLIAEIRLLTSDSVARVACADGAWYLKKRRPLGWDLLIESSRGQNVGWYSGRRWLPGGTVQHGQR